MAKRNSAQQAAILKALKEGKSTEADPDFSKVEEEVPDGPRNYMGLPGTTIVGIGKFPRTEEDPEVQARIENSRSFKNGHVWLDNKTPEQNEQIEAALDNLSLSQLQKLALACGQRDISRLTKLQLLEVVTRDGASLL